MLKKLLLLSLLFHSTHAAADPDYFRPRVTLSAMLEPMVSDTDYSFLGGCGALDLRLGGFSMGAFFNFSDGLDIPISYVAIGGRMGGHIFVNPHLTLYPYVLGGYDYWFAQAENSDESITTIRIGSGLQFIIRAAGRFLIFVGPELRDHLADEGDVLMFVINIGLGVGLGGEL